MENFRFLNVDVEIESRSSLQPLIDELGDRISILYTESKPHRHFLSYEAFGSGAQRSADKVIEMLCADLEALSSSSREIWNRARMKIFDVGIDIESGRMSQFKLKRESIQRIAALGASITFTCYMNLQEMKQHEFESLAASA